MGSYFGAIDMTDLVNDPDLAQSFQVLRSTTGAFQQGGFTDSKTTVNLYGPIWPATAEDVRMFPEMSRVEGSICAISSQQLYRDRPGALADIIVWQSNQYRVMSVTPWQDHGYWLAIAERMQGI